MMRSITVARIRDIDIRLHPTFALVFLWVLIDWRRIGTEVGISSILFTLILVILIFACVLLHEFGHAFMARQHGVRVHDVSLSAVGGVARMEQLPADPRAEVLIATAGPAANFAVVVALAPVVLLIGVVSGFSSLEEYASKAPCVACASGSARSGIWEESPPINHSRLLSAADCVTSRSPRMVESSA